MGRGKDWVAGRVPELVKEIVRWGSDWWTTERVSKVVEGWLPRRDLDIVVIDGMFSEIMYLIDLTWYSTVAFSVRVPQRRSIWERSKRYSSNIRGFVNLPWRSRRFPRRDQH